MMRAARLTTVALAMFAVTAQAQEQESLLALCTEAPVTDRTIEVCSQLLENEHPLTSQQRTKAYGKRAYLFYRQGSFDRAISDYDQMIQSDPEDSFTRAERSQKSAKGVHLQDLASYLDKRREIALSEVRAFRRS